MYYGVQLVLAVAFISRGISVFLAFHWIQSLSLQHLIYIMQHRCVNPITTEKQHLCAQSQALFSPYPPITRGLLRLERSRGNSVPGIKESIFAAWFFHKNRRNTPLFGFFLLQLRSEPSATVSRSSSASRCSERLLSCGWRVSHYLTHHDAANQKW